MKKKIINDENDIITVKYIPNKLEHLFGCEANEIKYIKDDQYKYSAGYIWYNYDTGMKYNGIFTLLDNYLKSKILI